MANYLQTFSFNGLGTQTTTVPTTGPYFVKGNLTLPTLTGGSPGASACLVTITQNSTPVYTGVAGAEGFYAELNCTAADSIAIALTSSAAPDLLLNVIKGVGSLGTGT